MSSEELLTLPDGRTLAYEHIGPADSPVVLIFFLGTLAVGSASPQRHPRILASRNVHYISPTLPGYGKTSPTLKGVTYASTVARDVSALLDHLGYLHDHEIELHIGGGSFGTVPAQMLYGAPFDIFPQGRYIKKMILLGAFPPLAHCADDGFPYARYMTWMNYISAGPPAKYIPFRIVPRLMVPMFRSKLKSQEGAELFLRQILFDKMGPEERELYKKWREERGYEEGQLVTEMAEMNRRSVAVSWEGLMSTAEVLHSEWWGGKKLTDFDEEHTKGRKVLFVAGDKDDSTPRKWAEYLLTKYPNSQLKVIGGGHIGAIFYSEEFWTHFMDM